MFFKNMQRSRISSCPHIMPHGNIPNMARFRKCPPTKNGILVGADAIAATFGVDRRTISRWAKREGFPVATLPTGHVATTLGLIDLWLLGRLKAPGKAKP